jgi:LacI family transcriptional regulator
VPDAAAGVPFVILNGESPGHACVLRDERTAGRLVVRYLIERGHRRIAVIGDSVALRTNRRLSASVGDRFDGLEVGLAEAGLEFVARYHEDDWEPERGFAAMTRLLDDDPGATAVVALNDRLAFGAYQALSERGMCVPDQVSMVSFDDDVIASYVNPGLTTMRLPYEEMGREAMRMLLSGRPSGTLHVPLQLQERGSVRTLSA